MASVVFSTDIDDDGTGTTGTVHNNAWKQAMATNVNTGFTWSTPTFSAGDYTASGAMTWTVASGDVIMNRYIKIGELLIWVIQLSTTSVGGTPNNTLIIRLPASLTEAITGYSRCDYVNDNGTVRDNGIIARVDGTHLGITLTSGVNWAASTNNTYIYFSLIYGVN